MPSISFLILLAVGLLFTFFGALSALAPKAAIIRDRRPLHTLRMISKDRLETPIKKRSIIFERLQGCLFLILGIVLIHNLGDLLSLWTNHTPSSSNAADRVSIDFKSTVKALVASEGLLFEAPAPTYPGELHIISAEYGARDTWIDVTEQVRENIHDNTLTIGASNAIAGDPLDGVPKRLKVEYRWDGERKTAEVREGVILRINDPYDELAVITTPERLVALAKACPAEVGFFGKNLTTGKTVEYRPDQPACLASIVKIFVLLEVMRQADQGTLDLSELIAISRQAGTETCTLSVALDKMIGVSDNEATNALAARVGYDRINRLPAELGIQGLSDKILPEPGLLDKVLDKRIAGPRLWPESDLLHQHGTARGIVQYFELLNAGQLLNETISEKVLDVFDRNPKGFAPRATPLDYKSVGKGGGLSWRRGFHPEYNMGGWGLLIRSDDVAVTFCLWCEWFPEEMGEEKRWEWYTGLSDCIVSILLSPESTDNRSKEVSQQMAIPDVLTASR